MANDHSDTIETVGAAQDHGTSGLPQLDFNSFQPQLVWLVITFAFLYFVMSRVALPRIGSVIEERKDKIADDLDRASELKKEAEDALSAYEQALSEAKGRAHTIGANTRAKVKTETDTLQEETEAKLNKKLEASEAQIRDMKNAALANVKDVAADAASAIVEKLIGKSIDKSVVALAVEKIQKRS